MTDDDHQIGYKALPPGVPVFTSDGVELGKVHRVQDNEREHIFDGLVVSTRNGVTLTIDAAEAAQLPEHRGLRGVLQTHAKRTGQRWKRRLSR